MIEGEGRYARLAARVLREGLAGSAPERGEERDDHRDALVAAMAVAIAAKTRRHQITLAASVVLAAAAAIVVFVKLSKHHEAANVANRANDTLRVEHQFGAGNYLNRADNTRPLPELGALAIGDVVRSDASSSSLLGFDNGTRIALARSSRMRVDELGKTRRFALLAGHLQAHVTKLTKGERFIVDTPDSEVEVRGTVFSVNVAGPSQGCRGETTTVEVSEGAVWVRAKDKQVVLHPGETWTVPCAQPVSTSDAPVAGTAAPAAPSPAERPTPPGPAIRRRELARRPEPAGQGLPAAPAVAAAPTVAPKPAVAPAPAVAPEPAEHLAPPVPVSHLAEQNDLLAASMSAERQGQRDLALRRLNLLIERYPQSPLIETARAEQQRILSTRNP